jgi:uncharacterized protein YidB (DUF937 family)
MSLIDTIKNSLGGSVGGIVASALPGILEAALPGGVQGLLNKLQQSGYGQQVSSWLGRGPNQPITTEDLRRVLGTEQAQAIAQRLGIPPDDFLALLAKLLPEAVDQQSPEGTLQTPKPAA